MELLNNIDQITENVKVAFGNLSEEELNWKPHLQKWSIAQNIEHLVLINESFFPTFDALQTNNYKLPVLAKLKPYISFMGKTVLQYVSPDRKKRMKTFALWKPEPSTQILDSIHQFCNHQNCFKEKMEGCKHLLNKGIVIASPATSLIVYQLDVAFEGLIAHEERHLAQALEVKRILEKRK